MSIRCELFAADPVDALHYEDVVDDDESAERFEVVPLGGLTQLPFEMLWAMQWARTEEMDCAIDEVEPIVSALIDLARSAVESNKGLYLWGSL